MNRLFSFALSISVAAILCGCGNEPTEDTVFSISREGSETRTLNFDYKAGNQVFQLSSNASWTLSSDRDWCTVSYSGGNATIGSQQRDITVTVERNNGTESRSAVITLKTGGEEASITVTQSSRETVQRPVGMELEAMELVKRIHMGWNLGNTLEAYWMERDGTPNPWIPHDETAWGNPKATRELITAVKALGFNAVRLPCSWNQYLDANDNIDPAWMARVKEVVDYCVDQQVYTVLNVHWDGGWMEEHCGTTSMTEAQIDAVDRKLAKIWGQIAVVFKDYGEYLLFAGANEPNVDNARQMEILARYEQTFVNVVRASGGNNEYRNLVIQGPRTDLDLTTNLMKLPDDETPGSLILEVHFYSPWWFVSPDYDATYSTYFWGRDYIRYGKHDSMQEEQVLALFRKIKSQFVDDDIPIIMGEFGMGAGAAKLTHLDSSLADEFDLSRCYYNGFVVENAKNHGMAPFLWDTGGFIDRGNYTVKDRAGIDAILEGAEKGNYPF